MNLRDHPWENVFNFVMVSIVAGALIAAFWVQILRAGGLRWQLLTAGLSTLAYVRFVGPRIIRWFRNDAR